MNEKPVQIYNYGNFKFHEATFKDIRAGDLVLIEKDQDVPADMVVVMASSESIFVDTSKIDGESTLK